MSFCPDASEKPYHGRVFFSRTIGLGSANQRCGPRESRDMQAVPPEQIALRESPDSTGGLRLLSSSRRKSASGELRTNYRKLASAPAFAFVRGVRGGAERRGRRLGRAAF